MREKRRVKDREDITLLYIAISGLPSPRKVVIGLYLV